jgi:hypothetical protein
MKLKRTTKSEAVKSLSEYIEAWLNDPTVALNELGSIDIGYIPEKTSTMLASVVVDVLMYSGKAQNFAVREGFLRR